MSVEKLKKIIELRKKLKEELERKLKEMEKK